MTDQPERADDITINPSRLVDIECDRFLSLLKQGSEPRIEEFLSGHASPIREELLERLVHLETDHRGGFDDEALSDLQQRLPDDSELLSRIASQTIAPGITPTHPFVSEKKGKVRIGEVLGDYELIGKIGAGGMGQVFKARHRRMKRIVALKMLPDSLAESKELIQRFQREVEAAAQLDHPNIVTAYDAGEDSGVHFLVMQYIEGDDLSTLIQENGPFSPQEAVKLTIQVAKGLKYAHAKGVVHRDIKPANLLLDSAGTLKILDMGLARFENSLESENRTELTQAGAMMGTADYLPPEQALDSRRADNRSDIYSLGCTLYHMLTGSAVYKSDTLMQTIMAHRDLPIPQVTESVQGLPSEFDELINTSLAKNPAERFQTMDEMIPQLEALIPLTEDLTVSVQEQAKPVNAEDFASYKSNGSNAELASIIHQPNWTPLKIRIGIAFVATLLLISLVSMFVSYSKPIASQIWLTRFDELPGNIFEGFGFEIGCLRALIYLSCVTLIFWKNFREEIRQILSPKNHSKGIWITRILLCVLSLGFGAYESYRHLTPDAAPRELAIASGIESPSDELVNEQVGPYAAFLPYSLVNYMVVVPLLVVVPFASAAKDFPKIQMQGKWMIEKMDKGRFKDSQIIAVFQKFESNCQAICVRYLSFLMILLVAINFECWIGRYTLSESGFSLMLRGWTICGLAGVACFIWMFSVYVQTNQIAANTLIRGDSLNAVSFRNNHNGATFLKWILTGTGVGLIVSGLFVSIVIWSFRG